MCFIAFASHKPFVRSNLFASHGSGGKSSGGLRKFGPQRMGSLRADNFIEQHIFNLEKRF